MLVAVHLDVASRRSGPIAAIGLAGIVGATTAGLALERSVPTESVGPWDYALLGAFFSLPLVGLLLVWRRPSNAVGWLLAAMGVLAGLYLLAHGWAVYGLRGHPGSLPGGAVAAWLVTWTVVPTIGLLPFIAATFPTGRIDSKWLRPLGVAAAIAVVVAAWAQAVAPDDLDGVSRAVRPIPNPLGVPALRTVASLATAAGVTVVVVFGLAAVGDAVVRYRRSIGTERQQLRWVAWALSVVPLTMAVALTVPHTAVLAGAGQILGLLATSAAIVAAILRYRLYDLGAFVRRTAAYVGLSVAALVAVAAVASLVGVVLTGGRAVPAVVATAVVALALGPARARMQNGIDRLLFGRRHDPFSVLTEIGTRLEASQDPATALREVAVTLTISLHVPYAGFDVHAAGLEGFRVDVGSPPDRQTRVPLVHEHESLGDLVVGHRSFDEDFTSAELQLLADLGRQAATVLHAMTVTAALRRARTALVDGREEERRRLRRDLHDGVGPTLAATMLQLDALDDLIASSPTDAGELVEKLKEQVRSMVSDVRRAAHDLRPPALDELGVVEALREHIATITAAGSAPRFHLVAPDPFGPLPAAVEVAAYRIASEAITNVVRHAHATQCTVELQIDNGVNVRVVDDGIGIEAATASGVGLISMRERAGELGGTLVIEQAQPSGTIVHARLPANR